MLASFTKYLSQCPGKRAGHCYGALFTSFHAQYARLNALESGPVIVTDLRQVKNEVIASLNALESGPVIVTTPFWRPVALRLVSPESLTSSPDPLRSQNKEFGTPFSEVK
jgi:hypothetical protein